MSNLRKAIELPESELRMKDQISQNRIIIKQYEKEAVNLRAPIKYLEAQVQDLDWRLDRYRARSKREKALAEKAEV